MKEGGRGVEAVAWALASCPKADPGGEGSEVAEGSPRPRRMEGMGFAEAYLLFGLQATHLHIPDNNMPGKKHGPPTGTRRAHPFRARGASCPTYGTQDSEGGPRSFLVDIFLGYCPFVVA